MDRTTQDSLVEGLNYIDTFVDALDLTHETKTKATEIYRQVVQADEDLFIGRSFEAVGGACTVLAARQTGDMCSAEDIADIASDHTKRKRVHRITRSLLNELDMGLVLDDPSKYVEKFQNERNASDQFIDDVNETVKIVKNGAASSGHKAATIAGCAIYVVTKFHPEHTNAKHTQKEISDTVGVSTVTIRSHYADYAKCVDESPDSPITLRTP